MPEFLDNSKSDKKYSPNGHQYDEVVDAMPLL